MTVAIDGHDRARRREHRPRDASGPAHADDRQGAARAAARHRPLAVRRRRASTPPRSRRSRQRPGVSKPVVYEHFGGKEGLYAVVVDREMSALLDAITGALTQQRAPARAARAGGVRAARLRREVHRRVPHPGARLPGRAVDRARFASLISDAASQVEHIMGNQFKARGFDPKLAPMYAQMLVGMVALTGQWWLDARKPEEGRRRRAPGQPRLERPVRPRGRSPSCAARSTAARPDRDSGRQRLEQLEPVAVRVVQVAPPVARERVVPLAPLRRGAASRSTYAGEVRRPAGRGAPCRPAGSRPRRPGAARAHRPGTTRRPGRRAPAASAPRSCRARRRRTRAARPRTRAARPAARGAARPGPAAGHAARSRPGPPRRPAGTAGPCPTAAAGTPRRPGAGTRQGTPRAPRRRRAPGGTAAARCR